MIRAVLAVALAAALLGASLPAVDDARRDHTEQALGVELQRVERAAASLLRSDDPVTGAGARRVVSVSLPAESWTDAGVERVRVSGGRNGSTGVITWTVRTGRHGVRRLPDVPLRTPDGEALKLESAGMYRLVLSLERERDATVVRVRRFMNGEGSRAGHATLAPRGT